MSMSKEESATNSAECMQHAWYTRLSLLSTSITSERQILIIVSTRQLRNVPLVQVPTQCPRSTDDNEFVAQHNPAKLQSNLRRTYN